MATRPQTPECVPWTQLRTGTTPVRQTCQASLQGARVTQHLTRPQGATPITGRRASACHCCPSALGAAKCGGERNEGAERMDLSSAEPRDVAEVDGKVRSTANGLVRYGAARVSGLHAD